MHITSMQLCVEMLPATITLHILVPILQTRFLHRVICPLWFEYSHKFVCSAVDIDETLHDAMAKGFVQAHVVLLFYDKPLNMCDSFWLCQSISRDYSHS